MNIFNYNKQLLVFQAQMQSYQKLMQPLFATMKSLEYQQKMQTAIKITNDATIKAYEAFNSSLYFKQNVEILNKTFETLRKPIIECASYFNTPQWVHMINQYKFELSNIDFNSLKVNENGTLEYENQIFEKEDIIKVAEELPKNLSISKEKKKPLLLGIILFIISAYLGGFIGAFATDHYNYLKEMFLNMYGNPENIEDEDSYFNDKCKIVSVSELNVREKASINSKIIGKLYYFQLIQELDKVPYWTKIEYIDKENDTKVIGWVSTKCIKSYNKLKYQFESIEE